LVVRNIIKPFRFIGPSSIILTGHNWKFFIH